MYQKKGFHVIDKREKEKGLLYKNIFIMKGSRNQIKKHGGFGLEEKLITFLEANEVEYIYVNYYKDYSKNYEILNTTLENFKAHGKVKIVGKDKKIFLQPKFFRDHFANDFHSF